MEYETVIYEKEGQVANVILNRPHKLNALNPDLQRDITAALTRAEDDDDVKIVVLKGEGRCFSAGASLDEVGYVYGMKDPEPGQKGSKVSQRVRLTYDRNLFLEFFRKVLLCRKITIAQLHGYCLGIMFTVVMHCDLLVASEDCKLGHVEERLGLGGMTISPLMVLRCGLTRALELCLTGKMITASQAAEYQLINRVTPRDMLDREVRELAAGLALYPKDGIAIGKSCRELMYDTMGVTRNLLEHSIMHSFQTNRVYSPDESNFFKERRDKGVRDAAHEKHDYYKALDK
jgi:enoyl-CoA hydratase